jgi:hypothetical protein
MNASVGWRIVGFSLVQGVENAIRSDDLNFVFVDPT